MPWKALVCAAGPVFCLSFQDVDGFSFGVREVSTTTMNIRLRNPSCLSAVEKDETTASSKLGIPQNVLSGTSTEARQIRRRVVSLLQEQDYEGARQLLMEILGFLQGETLVSYEDGEVISAEVDQALQSFYNIAFNPPYRGNASRKRISHGVDLLNMQLSHPKLVSPYDKVPRTVLLGALRALTGLNEVVPMSSRSGNTRDNADLAYRILQRLVTGVGIRHLTEGSSKTLYEKDFTMVLNAYTNIGRMDMAHRIVALQERTASAPILSPVAFSILLKGYGRLGDLYNIDMLLVHAEAKGIEVDTIMLNSLIDAYINCGEFDKAQCVFDFMKSPSPGSALSIQYPNLFDMANCPNPSRRTFNIMLKGLARRGLLKEAQNLADEMKSKKLWDHVTTNTLVQAAVKAHDFGAAEDILAQHTMENKKPGTSHPNAEAYTSAVDGFAKEGDMTKALELLKRMRTRGVDPNEFTYTCVIGAMAKNKRIEQAKKMLQYMKSEGIHPRVVTYNAFLSGLVHREGPFDDPDYDRLVDESISVLKQMMREGVHPNAVTVSVLVGGFGKCNHPRVTEALSLVRTLENDGIIPKGNLRISTAVIQLLGVAGDFEDALAHFRGLVKPDVAAINAILDVSVRCNKDHYTMQIFDEFFRDPKGVCRPDVISYSTAIASALKKVSYDGSKDARKLYEEMKFRRRITPDNALVDM
jgi:pentatricopeptide repeat protein